MVRGDLMGAMNLLIVRVSKHLYVISFQENGFSIAVITGHALIHIIFMLGHHLITAETPCKEAVGSILWE